MEQSEYEATKAALKDERDAASEAFGTWRKCPECTSGRMRYCDQHREAMDRLRAAKERLRAHYDNVPAHLRPPSRVERMRTRLARRGIKPVWER